MSTYSGNRGRVRGNRRSSELDWFGEDPWADGDDLKLDEDMQDDWYPGELELWEPGDEELKLDGEDEVELEDEDPHDGWGPIRRRGRPAASR